MGNQESNTSQFFSTVFPVGDTHLFTTIRFKIAVYNMQHKISYVTFVQMLRFLEKTPQSLLVLLQEEGRDRQVQQQSSCPDLMSEGEWGYKGRRLLILRAVNTSRTYNAIWLSLCHKCSSDNLRTPDSFRTFSHYLIQTKFFQQLGSINISSRRHQLCIQQ